MINLIVGQGAIGKTLYLKQLLTKIDINEVATNLVENPLMCEVGYNNERIEVLDRILIAEIIKGRKAIIVHDQDIKYSNAFLELITLMCRDKSILILDEPGRKLRPYERMLLTQFLAWTARTYTEVYVVTHQEMLLALPKKKVYTVQMDEALNINLIEVGEDMEDEVTDGWK